MKPFCVRLAVLAAAMVVAGAPSSRAADPSSQAEAQREASVQGILTRFPAEAVATQRVTCMMGEEPGRVAQGRDAGKGFLPDAADTCVAVLVRTAHDGHLPDLYRTLLAQLGGDAALAAKLPQAIGHAALSGDSKVALGNGKDTDVPPPLAFDAGFTAAYLAGDTREANLDPATLKIVTEACLGVRKDAGTCFSAGYAQGGMAFKANQ